MYQDWIKKYEEIVNDKSENENYLQLMLEELKLQDKIINLMADTIDDSLTYSITCKDVCIYEKTGHFCEECGENCKKYIKKYFEKKAKEEK